MTLTMNVSIVLMAAGVLSILIAFVLVDRSGSFDKRIDNLILAVAIILAFIGPAFLMLGIWGYNHASRDARGCVWRYEEYVIDGVVYYDENDAILVCPAGGGQ